MSDLVVAGGRLMEAADPCDVVITGGRVEAVVPAGAAGPATDTLDATGCLVLPGLVEAHCHLDKTLFGRPWVSHLAEDTLPARIEHDRGRRSELGIPDPQAMRALVDAMTGSGTTTLRTHTDVDPEVGLRGVLAVAELAARGARRGRRAAGGLPPARAALAAGHRGAAGRGAAGRCHRRRRARPGCRGRRGGLPRRGARPGRPPRAAADLHFHGHGAEGLRELELLVERTVVLGLQGRVVASHCYVFGDLDELEAGRLAERLADAGIGVVTAAPYSFPVPPLRLLAAAGVVTGIGHDGIRDLWGPYGTGDLLERARHVAYRSAFRRDDDIELVLRAATIGGRELLTGDRRGVEPGAAADLVVVPATNAAEAVVLVPERRAVVRRGVVSRAAGPPAPPPAPPER